MLRQYFNCNERLEMFLTCFCNILYYMGLYGCWPRYTSRRLAKPTESLVKSTLVLIPTPSNSPSQYLCILIQRCFSFIFNFFFSHLIETCRSVKDFPVIPRIRKGFVSFFIRIYTVNRRRERKRERERERERDPASIRYVSCSPRSAKSGNSSSSSSSSRAGTRVTCGFRKLLCRMCRWAGRQRSNRVYLEGSLDSIRRRPLFLVPYVV